MAVPTPRYLYTNLAIAADTTIDASSAHADFPVAWLRDGTPSKPWRSQLGWNIVAGWNDKLDFNRGGDLVATITAGNYATGAAMATAVLAALEAADATPVWACSYSAVTKKFTISSDTAFVLLFESGTNVWSSTIGNIGSDLGYAITDTASGTSAVADTASYKSREWIRFDLAAASAYTAGVAHDHNLGSGSTVKLLGKTAADVWDTPANTQTLAGDDLTNKRILFFASQSYRYVLLLIEDVTNTAGYTELGVPFVGTYLELSRCYAPGHAETAEALTEMVRALEGAAYQVGRQAPDTQQLSLRYLSRADRDSFKAMMDAVRGTTAKHSFFARDPATYPGSETIYGVFPAPAQYQHEADSVDNYAIAFAFAEDLG